jgi:4a-hydroxytetrahydrobiopterin dehydratase
MLMPVRATRHLSHSCPTCLDPYLTVRDTTAVGDWSEVDGALERTYELGSFDEAIAFVNRVAALAEAENHHPDIAIAYRRVTLRWTTHSAGGITERDEELAERSDELA